MRDQSQLPTELLTAEYAGLMFRRASLSDLQSRVAASGNAEASAELKDAYDDLTADANRVQRALLTRPSYLSASVEELAALRELIELDHELGLHEAPSPVCSCGRVLCRHHGASGR